MPTIRGLSHVVLYVNDLEKMVAFYKDVLGLVKYREHAGRMVFLDARSQRGRPPTRSDQRTRGQRQIMLTSPGASIRQRM